MDTRQVLKVRKAKGDMDIRTVENESERAEWRNQLGVTCKCRQKWLIQIVSNRMDVERPYVPLCRMK